MGLDNGIYLLTKDDISNDIPINNYMPLERKWSEYYNSYRYELAYWRKCWNIRECFFKAMCEEKGERDEDNRDYILTPAMLEKAIKYQEDILTLKEWNNANKDGDTVWEFEEIEDNYKFQLETLKWVLNYLKEHEDDTDTGVIFYDSY